MQVVELTPCVGPARCQDDTARRGQPLKAGVAIDLQHTTEVPEMGGRTLCPAIRTVEVDGGRRFGPGPGSIVARIDPVSYTHLTLPTNREVELSVVDGSLKKKTN